MGGRDEGSRGEGRLERGGIPGHPKKKAPTFVRALHSKARVPGALEVTLYGHEPLARSAGLAFRHARGRTANTLLM
jgi:hypothetical protein